MCEEASTKTDLFDAVLLLGKLLGLSRSVATVFAILYSHEHPLTIDALVEASGLSKSGVSLALRELMQMGAVQDKTSLGARCRHYCGQPDLGQVAKEIVLARLKFPLSQLRDKLDGSSGTQTRFEQVRTLLDTLESTLASIQSEHT